MERNTVLIWFKKDLRTVDNFCLSHSLGCDKALPVYIHDETSTPKIGQSSRVWLHHSLASLQQSLDNHLNLYKGNTLTVLEHLLSHHPIAHVVWNKDLCPDSQQLEEKVFDLCQKNNVSAHAFNSNYLYGPNDVLKDDGTFYKVFTAFKKKALKRSPRDLLGPSHEYQYVHDEANTTSLTDLQLLPAHHWHESMMQHWQVGEEAAYQKLLNFIEKQIASYKQGRDFPALKCTSYLSPHLHFGEISPLQIYHQVLQLAQEYASEDNIEHFISELMWREFSTYLLYHFPQLPRHNFNAKFNGFPWQHDSAHLEKWQKGLTGYPIIDAGMRELWQTGYMHNRVRMIVASFLVKNLNIHWHCGQEWFWDCLLDADLANNSASWQWVAGSGADAAPYFRIFNPITQGEKFDPDGDYTRHFVPELKNLPKKYLFQPWLAPSHILSASGVKLGENYPHPIIDLSQSRQAALDAYKSL